MKQIKRFVKSLATAFSKIGNPKSNDKFGKKEFKRNNNNNQAAKNKLNVV